MAAEGSTDQRLSRPPDWALQRVPGYGRGTRSAQVVRLAGGTVNEVFRVDTEAGRFVLRLDGPAWRRPGVDRQRELALHRAAAADGLAPAIVDADPMADGLLVLPFLEGEAWSGAQFGDVSALWRLGQRLGRLHRLAPPSMPCFDPWQVAQSYLTQIEPSQLRGMRAALSRLQSVCVQLASETGGDCIVHGDLAAANLLENASLWLLDWEYAQRSDPLMDVACVLAYHPQAVPYRAELLAAADIDRDTAAATLDERIYVYQSLSWLWGLARGELGPPP